MFKTIELSKINSSVSRQAYEFAATDDVGENQGQPREPMTSKVTINVAAIRCFYPRRNENPGTRLTFTDGGGFAVTESYDDVKAIIQTLADLASPAA